MSQVVDFLNESKTFILQPLKNQQKGPDRLMQPWREWQGLSLVQPIRKKVYQQLLVNSKVEVSRYGKRKNGFGSLAKRN